MSVEDVCMLGKEFYESTRLSLIRKPVFVFDTDKIVRYLNHACRAVSGVRLLKKAPVSDEEEGEKYILNLRAGHTSKQFCCMSVGLFDETASVCVDASVCNNAFPVLKNGKLYTRVKTFGFYLYVPFFGGRLLKAAHDECKKRVNIDTLTENVSRLDVKCVCIQPLVDDIVSEYKKLIMPFGYRIDRESPMSLNALCNVNAFDIALVCELVMTVMLRRSDTRLLDLSYSMADGVFGITLRAECENERTGHMTVRDAFAADPLVCSIMSSVEELCELYSWKMVCRINKHEMSTCITLPVCNYDPLRFRGEDPDVFESAVGELTGLLEEQIINELK